MHSRPMPKYFHSFSLSFSLYPLVNWFSYTQYKIIIIWMLYSFRFFSHFKRPQKVWPNCEISIAKHCHNFDHIWYFGIMAKWKAEIMMSRWNGNTFSIWCGQVMNMLFLSANQQLQKTIRQLCAQMTHEQPDHLSLWHVTAQRVKFQVACENIHKTAWRKNPFPSFTRNPSFVFFVTRIMFSTGFYDKIERERKKNNSHFCVAKEMVKRKGSNGHRVWSKLTESMLFRYRLANYQRISKW